MEARGKYFSDREAHGDKRQRHASCSEQRTIIILAARGIRDLNGACPSAARKIIVLYAALDADQNHHCGRCHGDDEQVAQWRLAGKILMAEKRFAAVAVGAWSCVQSGLQCHATHQGNSHRTFPPLSSAVLILDR